jgi:ABC-2 type transport system permease protein
MRWNWSFYGVSDVNIAVSTAAILGFLALCIVLIAWIFRTGYKLKA